MPQNEAADNRPDKSTPIARGRAVRDDKRLGVVFDIDGTLIADSKGDVRVRPGAVEFLRWMRGRGHAAGIWTKASTHWANSVVRKLCPIVSGPHDCAGATCRETFDFVWCHEKCRMTKTPSLYWHVQYASAAAGDDGCRWCEVYGNTCHQCECAWDVSQCPCRYTKDLRKVFGYSSKSGETIGGDEEGTHRFTKERTLIVEDTPQNCRYNYGNAIYVPTYRGAGRHLSEDHVFAKLQCFFERELEMCDDVRFVKKCNHGRQYHACYQQSWLTD